MTNEERSDSTQVAQDDERRALSEFLFTVYDHGTQPNALREADAILSFLASRRPAAETCAWCERPSRGSAWHNDYRLHPSCGQIGHGGGWVPGGN